MSHLLASNIISEFRERRVTFLSKNEEEQTSFFYILLFVKLFFCLKNLVSWSFIDVSTIFLNIITTELY